MTSERTKAMDDLIAQDADLIEFMASDAACYLYPDEGQKAERAAYTRGCAEQAAELAKFKALAETLAGAMRRIHKTASHPTNPSRNLVDIKFVSDLALHNYDAAMRQYKEARDV